MRIGGNRIGHAGKEHKEAGLPTRQYWQLNWLASSSLAMAIALLFIYPRDVDARTLDEQFGAAVRAFQQGAYGEAVELFDAFDRVFGREPEALEPAIRRVTLSFRGYAHLVGGNAATALECFEQFLQEFDSAPEQQAFVYYAKAQAHEKLDAFPDAIETYERFAEQFPRSGAAGHATLRAAELRLHTGDTANGIAALIAFAGGSHADSLRAQARLRALQALVANEDYQGSADLFFRSEWSITAMPELAVLAFSALRIGDWLLENDRPTEAVRAYRHVPPLHLLIDRQKDRLREVQESYARFKSKHAGSGIAAWDAFYRGLIGRIEQMLIALKSSEDYTPSFLLRFGQALMLAGRPREAVVVFSYLAEDPELSPEICQEAHHRWIIAEQERERWDVALLIAQQFLNRYPNAEIIPDTLFLIARTYQEKDQFTSAADILTQILDRYPAHRRAVLWRHTLGFVTLQQELFEEARAHFAMICQSEVANPAAQWNARYWIAMAWQLERHHMEAINEFQNLVSELPEYHQLAAASLYREASSRYALRDYDGALTTIAMYLERFPGHHLSAEAIILRGDILMGQGRLQEAIVDFRRVTPEAGPLFSYAVFQVGKILRALEDYDSTVKHFQDYIERSDMTKKSGLSEALYWIGWSRMQQDRAADAVPVFTNALLNFGNDPHATGITGIINALKRLFKLEGVRDALGGHETFISWLETERRDALQTNALTWYARISIYLADEKKELRSESEDLIRQVAQRIPIKFLDAEGRGRVGLLLHSDGAPEAAVILESVLEDFPKAPERAFALYGLGRIAEENDLWEVARQRYRQLLDELPGHPLMPEANLRHGIVLTEMGQFDAAVEALEGVLRLRLARGRLHAEALQAIARLEERRQNPNRAIAYYQRVLNMYRAYPDLVADAYARSATLFEQEGDFGGAYKTWREVLFWDHITDATLRARAEDAMRRLEPLVPLEAATTYSEPVQPDNDSG